MSDKILITVALIVFLGAAFIIWQSFSGSDITPAEGPPIDITQDPVQIEDTSTMLPPMSLGGDKFFFTVKAKYKLSGMIVSTNHYVKGFLCTLSPYDFATVWGTIPQYLDYIKFTQVVRFCLFNYNMNCPVGVDYIQSHMANNHMIPSNKSIRKALKKAHKNDLVEIEGYLVYVMGNINKRGTTNWNSSLKRSDKGNGACEIIYVTRLRINDVVYQ